MTLYQDMIKIMKPITRLQIKSSIHEPRREKTCLTRSDTNPVVQPQKMAGGLTFRIKEVEGLYYLCSENKGADQLHGLRLCFRNCKEQV